jgi:hypothetical protein
MSSIAEKKEENLILVCFDYSNPTWGSHDADNYTRILFVTASPEKALKYLDSKIKEFKISDFSGLNPTLILLKSGIYTKNELAEFWINDRVLDFGDLITVDQAGTKYKLEEGELNKENAELDEKKEITTTIDMKEIDTFLSNGKYASISGVIKIIGADSSWHLDKESYDYFNTIPIDQETEVDGYEEV